MSAKQESRHRPRPIFVANGEMQAQQVRSFLQGHGIKTLELGDSFRNLFDISEGESGAVGIFVDPGDEDQAKSLLRSADAGEFRLPDEDDGVTPPDVPAA